MEPKVVPKKRVFVKKEWKVTNTIPTLKEKCLRYVADKVMDGMYVNLPEVLPVVLINHIFQLIHMPKSNLVEKSFFEIVKQFQFNEVVVDYVNLKMGFPELVYSKHITKLTLLELECARVEPAAKTALAMGEKGRAVTLNLDFVLKRFLNPNSCRDLSGLSISGHDVIFRPHWVTNMLQMLPSLTVLDLNGCYFTNQDLLTLCQSNLSLESLSIGRTEVTNLKGLGLQKKLKILALEELRFENPEDVADLFLLSSLEVLDVSANYVYRESVLSTTAELLTQCNSKLPALKFLDCSFNSVHFETIDKLVVQFPNLEQLSVIDTDLAEIADLGERYKPRRFLTTADLPSCIHSLMFYTSSSTRSKIILVEILELLNSKIKGQKKETIRRLATSLAAILRNRRLAYEVHLLTVYCIQIIAKHQPTLNKLFLSDRKNLVDAICIAMKVDDWPKKESKPLRTPSEIVVQGIALFSSTKILKRTNLHQKVFNLMTRTLEWLEDQTSVIKYKCLVFIANHTNFISTPESVPKQLPLRMAIMSYLKEKTNMESAEYRIILNLLKSSLRIDARAYGLHEVQKELLKTLFAKAYLYEQESRLFELTFEVIAMVWPQLSSASKRRMFTPQYLQHVEHFLKSYTEQVCMATTRFLLEIFVCDYFHLREYNRINLIHHQSEIWRIIKEHGLQQRARMQDIFTHIGYFSRNYFLKGWSMWFHEQIVEGINYG
ncbi:hypothetical protein CAEBREN_00527 [Caenorhabditis brenneri]|uniref:Uncharacterized protein n=1 Tax=Caenorhabditis brenneri TaxID=135651 RepID=G0NNA7_CAEBE|nr:hypothetical protein CAEBREN_00527 [Caenorhabditis brenneri]